MTRFTVTLSNTLLASSVYFLCEEAVDGFLDLFIIVLSILACWVIIFGSTAVPPFGLWTIAWSAKSSHSTNL